MLRTGLGRDGDEGREIRFPEIAMKSFLVMLCRA